MSASGVFHIFLNDGNKSEKRRKKCGLVWLEMNAFFVSLFALVRLSKNFLFDFRAGKKLRKVKGLGELTFQVSREMVFPPQVSKKAPFILEGVPRKRWGLGRKNLRRETGKTKSFLDDRRENFSSGFFAEKVKGVGRGPHERTLFHRRGIERSGKTESVASTRWISVQRNKFGSK